MQIYTRVGDKGQTKINGNYTVDKDSARVEAYGTIDELNSFVGRATSSEGAWPALKEELQQIQQFLFDYEYYGKKFKRIFKDKKKTRSYLLCHTLSRCS